MYIYPVPLKGSVNGRQQCSICLREPGWVRCYRIINLLFCVFILFLLGKGVGKNIWVQYWRYLIIGQHGLDIVRNGSR